MVEKFCVDSGTKIFIEKTLLSYEQSEKAIAPHHTSAGGKQYAASWESSP